MSDALQDFSAYKLRLTLSAKKLLDKDVFSKSDPMCVVFLKTGHSNNATCFRECGRTETIDNCLNPEWSKTIVVDYVFDQVQTIRFDIFDVDSDSMDVSKHDFLGRAETTIGEIVGSPFSKKTFMLEGRNGKCGGRGELTVAAEEARSSDDETITIACKAVEVDRKDFFGKSDPFLNFYRIDDDDKKQLVHRTECIMKTLNPIWKPFEISSSQLCGGDPHRRLVIECFDYNSNGKSGHDFIGSCETTLQRLLWHTDMELPLIDVKKQRKKGNKYVDSGKLVFSSVSSWRDYSFVDYIAGGTQLDFSLAVDMTSSNGHPSKETSLHHICASKLNDYQVAIRTVADICQHYNASKTFDAMGFGARFGRGARARVNHCFPLDIEGWTYEVSGLSGMLRAYERCVSGCTLYGPTFFGPVIQHAAKKARLFAREGRRYHVLLIITDGSICDFKDTKDAIISASSLPLSIIIIGVGKEDFTQMKELDSDDKLLSSGTRTAERDIVQFVALRDFISRQETSGACEVMMARLAKAVLEEIPEQLTSFMKSRDIRPRSRDDPFSQMPDISLIDDVGEDDGYDEIGNRYEEVRRPAPTPNNRFSAPPDVNRELRVSSRYANLEDITESGRTPPRPTSLPPSRPPASVCSSVTPTPAAQEGGVRFRAAQGRVLQPGETNKGCERPSEGGTNSSRAQSSGQARRLQPSGQAVSVDSAHLPPSASATAAAAAHVRSSFSGNPSSLSGRSRPRNVSLPGTVSAPPGDLTSARRGNEPPPPYSSIY